ncbi:hypothetical protein MD484_g1495, partial [Candolleomyces efflorescens]
MELVFSALAQAILFLTDGLLVIRCYAIFRDKPYVYGIAILSFLGSIGVAVFGIVSLSRADILTGDSGWNRFMNADDGGVTLPRGFTPIMSIVSSVVVNAFVAVAIVSQMLASRKRLNDSLPDPQLGGNVDVYGSAAALIVESALPPVIFGILASVFASPSIQGQLKVIEFTLVPKMAWLAFTVLAPQLILIRIMQGRAWGRHSLSVASTSISFRHPDEGGSSSPAMDERQQVCSSPSKGKANRLARSLKRFGMRFSILLSLFAGAATVLANPFTPAETELLIRNDGEVNIYGRQVTASEIYARDSALAVATGTDLTAREFLDDDEIHELVLRHLDFEMEERDIDLEPRAVAAIARAAVQGVIKIVQLIKGKIEKDKSRRGNYTHEFIGKSMAQFPKWNWVICHTKHTKKFDGKQGKDWFHRHEEFKVSFGKTIGYEIYWFKSGTFTRKGDGGYLNWAYGGNIKKKSKDGKVITFGKR